MMTARGAWTICGSFARPLLGNFPTRGGYLNRALAVSPITLADPWCNRLPYPAGVAWSRNLPLNLRTCRIRIRMGTYLLTTASLTLNG
ncbi:UNVERIFIED_CONTAM: hypothetical protein Sradi_1879300 [Sesamum radiatum]|uniref:Uncharacterized protein n=1 Tax=Sesamum radiatum TaxID=300843 RepID=A0AAW2TXK8_SESRA